MYQRCEALNSRFAIDQEIELCHSKEYIQSIRSLKEKNDDELKELSRNPNSVYFNSATFECASMATGCLLEVVDQVCSEKVFNFCFIFSIKIFNKKKNFII